MDMPIGETLLLSCFTTSRYILCKIRIKTHQLLKLSTDLSPRIAQVFFDQSASDDKPNQSQDRQVSPRSLSKKPGAFTKPPIGQFSHLQLSLFSRHRHPQARVAESGHSRPWLLFRYVVQVECSGGIEDSEKLKLGLVLCCSTLGAWHHPTLTYSALGIGGVETM